MLRNLATVALMSVILIFCTVSSAEIKTYEGVGAHYMENENETLAQAQDKAKLAAELKVMEEAQINVIGYSEMHNCNLTRDEIVTITAGIMNVIDVKYSLKDELGVLLMEAVVTAEIDTDKIAEFVEREIKFRGTE